MVKNYTQLDENSVKTNSDKNERNSSTPQDEGQTAPSSYTIMNLLNYSKALSVMSDKTTGNVHLILLN